MNARYTSISAVLSAVRLFALFIPSLLLFHQAAHAGAWTKDAGSISTINTLSYSTSDAFRDAQGNKLKQDRYSKYELNSYVEYGLTSDTTLGANLFIPRVTQSGASSYGIGDTELFVRQKLWEGDGFVFSLEPLIKLPRLYRSEPTPSFGNPNSDLQIAALGGYGFSQWGIDQYFDLKTAYRKRSGAPQDQWIVEASYGARITPDTLILPQLFATLNTGEPSGSLFTQASSDDYDMVKAQLSVVLDINHTFSVQAGGFTTLYARNTGLGSGAIIALWTRF